MTVKNRISIDFEYNPIAGTTEVSILVTRGWRTSTIAHHRRVFQRDEPFAEWLEDQMTSFTSEIESELWVKGKAAEEQRLKIEQELAKARANTQEKPQPKIDSLGKLE